MERLKYIAGPEGFSDWIGLHALLVECYSYMERRIDPPSSLKQMTPDTLRKKADDEMLVVVLNDDQIVACGYLKETDETVYVGKLAVKQAFRKKGILRSILQIADDLARNRYKSGLELETRIELTENHKTFEALGFVKTGESSHDGYDRSTDITMKRLF